MSKRDLLLMFLVPLAFVNSIEGSTGKIQPIAKAAPQDSAISSLEYLRDRMDRYHNRFPVYDDVGSPGNHFLVPAKIPAGNSPVTINSSWTGNPHSGATSIRCEFQDRGADFGGFIFMNGALPDNAAAPELNFGDVPDAGINLSGARTLSFWARGEVGGEKVEFFMGGVGRDAFTGRPVEPFPGSTPREPRVGTVFTLSKAWTKFTIRVADLDLSYVLGGFAWVATKADNPRGAVFYLDDIEYVLTPAARNRRLEEPRFIASYVTRPLQPDPFDGNPDDDIDLVFRNLAFSYDNAVSLLAFLADGKVDSLRRAKLIGDAFVFAANNDRFFDDGRIRSAYAAGDISLPPGWTPNSRIGTVRAPGFFDEARQRSVEIAQESTDIGNNGWAMIALLALFKETNDSVYLDTARRIGEFIRTFRNDEGPFQGFLGGVRDPEGTAPARHIWASGEHNIDVYAAFNAMFEITGESRWMRDAEHARAFVERLWDPGLGCYFAGTIDPSTINRLLLVNLQAWSVLGLPDTLAIHPGVLGCAEGNQRTSHAGFSGYDFDSDRDCVWFEGTAQMAVAYTFAGQQASVTELLGELQRAQRSLSFGDNRGIVSASCDGLTTGFDFKLFQRLHTAATAWNVFAQLGYNPYSQEFAGCSLPLGHPRFCRDCGPCSAGQGSCANDDECRSGLVCAENFRRAFDLGAAVDVCVAPNSVDPGYTSTELNALGISGDTLDSVSARAINNRGQIVGRAEEVGSMDSRRAAFRYTPDIGMEDLDVDATYASEGVAINEAGDVLGFTYNGPNRDSLFIYRDGSGFSFLNQGTNRQIRRTFELSDMNIAGDVVGTVGRPGRRRIPYLYNERDGWMNLSGLAPAIARSSTTPVAINDKSEILFASVPESSGARNAYVLLGGDRLIRLESFGRRINVPLAFNEQGRVVGYTETASGQARAYLYKPARRMINLHRNRFKGSFAGWLTVKGLVGGVFKNDSFDTLFTFDQRRTQKLKLVAHPSSFRSLLPSRASSDRVEVVDMNERLEFVGRVLGTEASGASLVRHFYFSVPVGLLDLQSLIDAEAVGHRIDEVLDINDLGAILIGFREGQRSGAIVLTPSET